MGSSFAVGSVNHNYVTLVCDTFNIVVNEVSNIHIPVVIKQTELCDTVT